MSNAPVEWRSPDESVTIQIELKFQVGLQNYSVLRYFLPNQLVAVVVLCVVCEEPPVLSVYFFPKNDVFSVERDFTEPSGRVVSR